MPQPSTTTSLESPNWEPGDHIAIKIGIGPLAYYHHGIYFHENGHQVVHYHKDSIDITPLEKFVSDREKIVEIVEVCYKSKFQPDEVVKRAKRLKGFLKKPENPDIIRGLLGQELDYHLLVANCEHFAYYCRLGEWTSRQIEQIDEFLEAIDKNSRLQSLLKMMDSLSDSLRKSRGMGQKAANAALMGALLIAISTKGLNPLIDDIQLEAGEWLSRANEWLNG